MKKFVPYYDGVLDKILPEDQLIPYQVGWAEYVAVPAELQSAQNSRTASSATQGEAQAHPRVSDPTA